MSESKLRSPNELFNAAKEYMLGGDEPISKSDWVLVMNFFAANIHKDVQPAALKLLRAIYDIPIGDEQIEDISKFQIERQNKN